MKFERPECLKCGLEIEGFVPEGHAQHIWILCFRCATRTVNKGDNKK